MTLIPAIIDGVKESTPAPGPNAIMFLSAVCLFLLILPILLCLILLFFKKKYQHQQILTAMEKGLPIMDLIAKPGSNQTCGTKNIAIGIGFLFIGALLGGVWWWMDRYGIYSVPPKYIAVPIVIVGLGLMFLLSGVLSGRGINWMWGLSIGIGFVFAGLAMSGLWLWTRTANDVTQLPTEFMMIPIAVGSLGLIFVFWGIYQRHFQKQKMILEALEKGLAVDELFKKPKPREENWIRNLSTGIACLFVGLALAVMWKWSQEASGVPSMPPFVLVIAIFIVGAGLFMVALGAMQKKKKTTTSVSPKPGA